MNIDAHQHFWSYNQKDYGWITDDLSVLKKDYLPGDLLAVLTDNGMDGCVAVQARQSLEETSWLLELAKQHDFIKGVVGWVDLCSTELEAQLKAFSKNKKLVGVRHVLHDEPDEYFMLRPEFKKGIERLGAYELTYDILIFPKHLKSAHQLAAQFPNQKFVIDHLAKPSIRSQQYDIWSRDLSAFKGLPNVWCKVSGMVTEADWKNIPATDFSLVLDVVFDTFPQEKIMFGSDWPVCQLAADYAKVKSIVEEYLNANKQYDAQLVMGKNCQDFYRIKTD